jgi:PAS domain-containing protein
MRRFIQKALKKVELLSSEQIRDLLDILSDENERLENVLNSMTDGILVTDEGHKPDPCEQVGGTPPPMMAGENLERPLWLAIEDEEISDFLKASLKAGDRVEDRQFTLDRRVRSASCPYPPWRSSAQGLSGKRHTHRGRDERKSREARLRRAESLASLPP